MKGSTLSVSMLYAQATTSPFDVKQKEQDSDLGPAFSCAWNTGLFVEEGTARRRQ